VRTLAYLLLLYTEYAMIVLGIGILLCVGLWFWCGIEAFARRARLDR
jgi:hypothetical protein